MNPRQNGRQPQRNERQHQRFSWQTPPETPPEQEAQVYHQPQQHAKPQQHPTRIDTNLDGQHNRVFSYAQTPAEHLAFQYIPSPNDAPPLPQSPPTPSDRRPQPIYTPHKPQPQPTYPTSYPEKPPLSPPSPHDRSNAQLFSPISPIADPQRTYPQQVPTQRRQHARNLRNLSPINTNIGQLNMPPVLATPHSQPGDLPRKTPITPITPSSIKKDPGEYPLPMSPNSRKSYAHDPYSPHGFSSAPANSRHAVFSPDSAHGPNGLDFALHQPGQIAHPNMDLSPSGSTRAWKSSLCSCTPDVSTCFTGLFCPCILYGRTSYRLSQKSSKQDATDLLSYNATNGHCIMMALSCGFWWLFPMIQRTRLRHMYKLEGGLGGDCVRGACCCCCVAVQNEREIKSREEVKSKWAGPASSEVYKSMGQMKYAPQM